LNSFVYVRLLFSMIPSPWVYHGLNFLSTLSGEVQPIKIEIKA